MSSIHQGHRGRTKEEFLARPDAFPDHKVLEVLLYYANPRGDTNPLAHTLMERFGSFSGVMDASPEELRKVRGMGDHAVALLKVVKEANRRYLASRTSALEIVRDRRDCQELLRPYFYGANRELAYLMSLDGKGRNLGIRLLGDGVAGAVEVSARKIAEIALSLQAVQVVLAHNHPSGIALPSDEDKRLTLYLTKTLSHLGITLADHMIFTDEQALSMRDAGFFAPDR